MKAVIQLARGINEEATDVKITRANDGSSSVATFFFEAPNCLAGDAQNTSEITGMFMIDEEGELVTRNVNGLFANGQSKGIRAIYKMSGEYEWERFLRFMDRYAAANGMELNRAQ
ncbi:MAG TPA: photosystem II reaction center protein Psb28 [Cyanobacteria bacterium UBA8156]|jgi:photosystem II protein|nr:photosystem II reaction center protein Psb28 [Cyanobacteria bacterium UBA8156]